MYDAVVVGLGGVGSFALRSLVKQAAAIGSKGEKCGRRPLKFLGLERFELGHTQGSSHGRTRIYRRAYFENENYVPWIEYSIDVFRDLERSHGVSLMQECGLLTIAPSLSQDQELLPPLLQCTKKSADLHNIPIEILSNQDLKQRYPQLCYRDNMIGIFEPTAGFLRPELILNCVQKDITSEENKNDVDVTVMENTQVLGIELIQEDGDGTSDDGRNDEYVLLKILQEGTEEQEKEIIKARCVLISAGSWSGGLLPPSWKRHLTVTRQIQSWIDVGSSAENTTHKYDPTNLPCWFMETPDWPIPIFGIPFDPLAANADERHWIKVGSHGRSDQLPDPSTNPSKVSPGEISELRRAVRRSFSAFSGSDNNDYNNELFEFADTMPCMYTMTPDHHYLIGSPLERVFCVAGLSGHGFKMAPALGRMMADYCYYYNNDDGNNDNKNLLSKKWNFDFCSPDRFD